MAPSVTSRTNTARTIAAAAPAAKVPARRSHHLRDAALLASIGLAAAGAAAAAHATVLSATALLSGIGLAVLVAVSGARRKRRHDLQDRLLEALAPLLGVRHLDRRIVSLSKWTKGRNGHPQRINIHYAPGAPDQDPQWRTQLLAVTQARLLASYMVTEHDRRRCRLQLRLHTDTGHGPPRAQVRAERAVTELIGPSVRVTGVDLDGEQLRSITVAHDAGAKLAAAGYRTRIERVISTMMPGRWRAVWDLENDTVRFEVRPHLPASVWLPVSAVPDTEDLLRNYRQVAIACAVDEDGREVLWYPARTPMVMLTGGTGSGKTSMAHALLGQVTRYGWPVWVLDAKRVEFLDFRTWPNVQIVAGSIPQQVALIHRAWELMEHRYALIEAGKARVEDFEPLVVFLDEFAEFRSNLIEWYATIKVKGDPTRPPTLAQAASLARKARTARIHLVLSTQRPDAEFLGGEMRDNFGFRISMGRLSPQGAMMMWENPAVGVTLPRACTGRATATHDDGKPVEVQCYRFPDMRADPDSDQARLLDQIRPQQSRWPRLVIVPPQPDPETEAPPVFRDYAGADWALAEHRPDLDVLSGSGPGLGAAGRELSSTLAVLGLSGFTGTGHGQAIPAVPMPVGLTDSEEPDEPQPEGDEYADYGPPVSGAPRDVAVGDLIEPEEGSGVWVVVDEEPEDDPLAPGLVLLSWRGDGDEAGTVSVPDDVLMPVRHPLELGEE